MNFSANKAKDMKDFKFSFKKEQTYCIKMVELFGHTWLEACAQLGKLLFWQLNYIPEELVCDGAVFSKINFSLN